MKLNIYYLLPLSFISMIEILNVVIFMDRNFKTEIDTIRTNKSP